jgi:hypothetical protein
MTPGIYSVPCKCGHVYTGQTGCSIPTRVKEHQQHICLEHPDKSAVEEHNTILGHQIQLQDNNILSTKSRYMGQMVREATEIKLHPKNMNRMTTWLILIARPAHVLFRTLTWPWPVPTFYKGCFFPSLCVRPLSIFAWYSFI